jgi:putative cell wall-binding protein
VTDNTLTPVTALINPTHVTSAADVLLRLPAAIAAGHTVTLVATGVTNPVAGTDTLTVATSKDAAAITSNAYSITSAVVGGGTGGTTPTVPALPVRISGFDRFGTAIAASQVEFPIAGTAGAVILARADNYPDALVGTALAAAKNAPLLFANGGLLTLATQAEIQRVLPAGGTVYLLGGTAAIPTSVATSLTSLGFIPVRYAGADRFGTALAVADALNDPSTVLLATGINFPDALAAGPAAAHVHGVVLLTNGSSLTPAVAAYLAAHPGSVYAIGGPSVVADPSAMALSGADRYATAAAVASTLFTAPANMGVASGTAFPDALSGGAFQAHFGGPIVLTDPHVLPASTSTYIAGAKTTIVITDIFGGTAAVSVTVQTAVGTALGL